ncbi:MAG: MFS transporter [Leptospiraceae bacterium]|nr:MAG: MFS transporter [Leptospiraceae bacterium]
MKTIRNSFSILLLVLIATFLQADQNLLAPNFPVIMKEFNITEKELGYITSAFVFISAFMTVIWGMLADFKTRKLLLLIGIMVGEIPCLLTAFVSNFWELFFMRMLTGIGIGSIIPIGYSLIADFFYGEERGKGYAYIETAFGFGTLMGMIMAGLILDWRLPFIIAAVPNLILAPIFYIITKEPKRGQSEEELEKILQEKEIQFSFNLEAFKKSLLTKTNQIIFFQGILGTVPWGIITTWFISYFIYVRGMNKDTATFVLLFIGLAAVFGSFIGGFLGDHFEKKIEGGRTYVAGWGVLVGMFASAGLLLYPFPAELTVIHYIGMFIYAILFIQFVSYAGPNVRAIISQVNLPEDRGTVFGIFNIMDNIGRAIGPLIGGLLIYYLDKQYNKEISYIITMLFGIAFWLPCGLLWFYIKKIYVKDRNIIKQILKERASSIK